MVALQQHLNELGLKQLPDEKTLKRCFREAIFASHPDRGGSHDKSQRLIAAYHALRAHVLSETNLEQEHNPARTIVCQVVQGTFGCYALPIDRIVSLQRMDNQKVRRFVHRTALEQEGHLYTLLTIRGRTSSAQGAYCCALFVTRQGRFGLVIPGRIEYSNVHSFIFQEMIWNRGRDGSMKFYTGGRAYEFPAFLSVT